VTVRGNRWFRHSTGQGGLAIDFVQEFYGFSFPDAVTLLLGGEQGMAFRQSDKKAPEAERKEFILPEAADNMRRVYAYLLKPRYIDRDVLTSFVKRKKYMRTRNITMLFL
jgi:DNA primase